MLRFMGLQRVRHDWVTELNRLICAEEVWGFAWSFKSV